MPDACLNVAYSPNPMLCIFDSDLKSATFSKCFLTFATEWLPAEGNDDIMSFRFISGCD